MISFITHDYLFFKRQEIWFYKNENIKKCTYNVFTYLEDDIFKNSTIEYSCKLDLTKNETEIFSNISKTFKYHIAKAIKQGVECKIDFTPSKKNVKNFISEFKLFASEKKIAFNAKRLLALKGTGNLCISDSYIGHSKISSHVYLFDKSVAVLLHSINYNTFSRPKRTLGYANKYLHWMDILSFKKKGVSIYDFGGIDKIKHPGITNFKLSFGAEEAKYYNSIRIKYFQKLLNLFKR